MRIVCISDTHTKHNLVSVPDGDILIHAGDITSRGNLSDLVGFAEWLRSLPHKRKIIIAGNHDFCFEHSNVEAREMLSEFDYLQDSSINLYGAHFYGSPWQPWFYDWAFNLRRGEEIAKVWEKIPNNADVVITHGPVMGYVDRTVEGQKVGCEDLRKRLEIVKPMLHVCGHIHEARGINQMGDTLMVNASVVNRKYEVAYEPIVVDLDVNKRIAEVVS